MSPYVVYGARCTWWDDKKEAVVNDRGLPVCPHCASPLFEIKWEAWELGVKTVDEKRPQSVPQLPAPYLYSELIEWSQGLCFPSFDDLIAAFINDRENDSASSRSERSPADAGPTASRGGPATTDSGVVGSSAGGGQEQDSGPDEGCGDG